MAIITGYDAIDHARVYDLTLHKYADPDTGPARDDLTIAEAKDLVYEIKRPSLVWIDDEIIRCRCGEITGEYCYWSGPQSETVVVKHVPPYLRATANACGTTRGLIKRIRVHHDCVETVCDGEWTTPAGDAYGVSASTIQFTAAE
jgi:hypothetical protein